MACRLRFSLVLLVLLLVLLAACVVSGKRQCIEPAAAAPGAGKQTKPAVAAAAGKGAFLQDVDDTAAMEVHQRQSTAATAGAAVGIHNRTAGAGRGKRNLRQKVGDDRVQDE